MVWYINTGRRSDEDRIDSKERHTNLLFSTFRLLKGGIPATPSGTATLLRLNPSY